MSKRTKKTRSKKNNDGNTSEKNKKLNLYKFINWIICIGIIPFIYSSISGYQEKYLTTFNKLTDSIGIVAVELENYAVTSGWRKSPQKNSLMFKMEVDLDNLVSYHRQLGHLISPKTYKQLHEFTYCYANKILNAGGGALKVKVLSRTQVDNWKRGLLKLVNKDKSSNSGMISGVEHYFTNAQNKKYSFPPKPYGMCK